MRERPFGGDRACDTIPKRARPPLQKEESRLPIAGCRFLILSLMCTGLRAQAPDVTFFETKIRPVLATKCYPCHSSALKAPMSGLVLDRKDGVAKVSDRLVKALSYTDPLLQMPPSGKLPDAVIADFEKWIAGGMPMPPRRPPPRRLRPATAYKGMSLEDGRKWWAFQPLKRVPPPKVKNAAWPVNPIDSFILEKLEAKGLKPSPVEEKRTLVRRAYVDLVGYKPTYRRGRGIRQRSLARCLGSADRPPASLAAIRRALGPALDGRGAFRRGQSDVGSHQPRVSLCVAVSRLDHRCGQSRRALRPLREAATRGRPDAGHASRRHAGPRLPGRRAASITRISACPPT